MTAGPNPAAPKPPARTPHDHLGPCWAVTALAVLFSYLADHSGHPGLSALLGLVAFGFLIGGIVPSDSPPPAPAPKKPRAPTEPLVDITQLPFESQEALRPLLAPGVTQLPLAETRKLIAAATVLMEDSQRLIRQHIDMAKAAAALDIAAAVLDPADRSTPGPDIEELHAQRAELERRLAEYRALLSNTNG